MGNYVFCGFVSPKSGSVVLPGGELRQFREAVKAAELMLESPNCFLVDSRSLNVGRRFSPLAADEDLEFGRVYVMLPMKRVHSVAAPEDVAVLISAATKRIQEGGSSKIAPDTTEPTTRVDDDERPGSSLEMPLPEFKFRLSVSRSKRPALDTILE